VTQDRPSGVAAECPHHLKARVEAGVDGEQDDKGHVMAITPTAIARMPRRMSDAGQ
jgi:hypothetical protein